VGICWEQQRETPFEEIPVVESRSFLKAAMPGATMPRAITTRETAQGLRQQLSSGYKVTPHSGGSWDKLTVSRGAMAFATVHLTWNER
jgi:hypothetical protein